MKLQAIKKACLAFQEFTVINDANGRQWMSNGAAMWPIDGIRIDANSVPALFDLSKKQLDECKIREQNITNSMKTVEPVDGEEMLIDLGKVWENGVFFRALQSKEGVLYIDCGLEKPAENGRDLTYAKRQRGDWICIAVYDGMLASAIIMPYRGDIMETRLRKIADLPVVLHGKEEQNE